MRGDRAFKDSTTFCQVPAHPPEISQCRRETDELTGASLTLPFVKLDSLPQVRMVDFETIEHRSLLTHILPIGMISQGEKCISVCLTHGILLGQFLQMLL